MDSNVQEFLTRQRVSVLGILQTDGSVHSATLHFSYQENPLRLFFLTEKDSRKCKSLLNGGEREGSLVIGFDEEEFATFQAEGVVTLVPEENLENAWDIYAKKFLNRREGQNNPEVVLLQFTPTWWSFRNLKAIPAIAISSEGK